MRAPKVLGWLGGPLMLTLTLAACGTANPAPSLDYVHLATEDGPPGGSPCALGPLVGVLAPSSDWGLGVIDSGGRLRPVTWPPAFAAARISGRTVLLDSSRRPIAGDGDTIMVPGDSVPDSNFPNGIWMACNNVSVMVAAPPAPT